MKRHQKDEKFTQSSDDWGKKAWQKAAFATRKERKVELVLSQHFGFHLTNKNWRRSTSDNCQGGRTRMLGSKFLTLAHSTSLFLSVSPCNIENESACSSPFCLDENQHLLHESLRVLAWSKCHKYHRWGAAVSRSRWIENRFELSYIRSHRRSYCRGFVFLACIEAPDYVEHATEFYLYDIAGLEEKIRWFFVRGRGSSTCVEQ